MSAFEMSAFDSESFSDKGGRAANEDAQGSAEVNGIWCWVVADGLGGHEGGQLASRTALGAVLDSFRRWPEVSADAIRLHIAQAHAAIQALQSSRQAQHQMGTTLVILISDGSRAVWGHVGDSRLFHIRGGRVVDQTRDHSMTQVPAGALAAGDGLGQEERERSGLLQAVGLTGEIIPAVLANPLPLAPGDAFLLCVDGFWDKVFEVEMEADLAKSDSARSWLRNMCQRIHARLKEGDDNYTAIAVRAVGVRAPAVRVPGVPTLAAKPLAAAPKVRKPTLRQAAVLTGVLAVAVVAFVGANLFLRWKKNHVAPVPPHVPAVHWEYPMLRVPIPPSTSGSKDTDGLYFGRFEVSQRDWKKVMGEQQDPSFFKECLNCPVEQVTWVDAIAFAKKASDLNGLQQCYTESDTCSGQPPEQCVRLVPNCRGYRLPTVAEWESVARSQVSEKNLKDPVWLKANAVVAAKMTQPRDRSASTPDRIYDLVGNVSEWNWDEVDSSTQTKAENHGGPPQHRERALRGCSYESPEVEKTCAPTYGRSAVPDTKRPYIGFRLVCTAGPQLCGGDTPPSK